MEPAPPTGVVSSGKARCAQRDARRSGLQRPLLRVRVTKYAKYACPNHAECGVASPERPTGVVEGDRYDTSVAAEIITAKHGYHLPVYRQQDLFAGSGSMGLEALSRGATYCCFFERQRAALDALRRNIRDLQAESAAEVILRDAWRAAATSPDGRAFDLIVLDPPYRESQHPDADGPVRRLLARLALSPDARPLVLLHHERSVCYELPPDDVWHILDQRTYGSNTITMFLR